MKATKANIWDLVRQDNDERDTARALGLTVDQLRDRLKKHYMVDDYDSMIRLVRQRQVNQMFSSLDSKETK